METKEYFLIDKKEWLHGEWNNEPDKLQYEDEETKLPCLIVRNNSGALCGYVGVSSDHPLFEKDYNVPDIDIHGGLTYSDFCQEEKYLFNGSTYKNLEYVKNEIKNLAFQLSKLKTL